MGTFPDFLQRKTENVPISPRGPGRRWQAFADVVEWSGEKAPGRDPGKGPLRQARARQSPRASRGISLLRPRFRQGRPPPRGRQGHARGRLRPGQDARPDRAHLPGDPRERLEPARHPGRAGRLGQDQGQAPGRRLQRGGPDGQPGSSPAPGRPRHGRRPDRRDLGHPGGRGSGRDLRRCWATRPSASTTSASPASTGSSGSTTASGRPA